MDLIRLLEKPVKTNRDQSFIEANQWTLEISRSCVACLKQEVENYGSDLAPDLDNDYKTGARWDQLKSYQSKQKLNIATGKF
jgi:hypothetical protein